MAARNRIQRVGYFSVIPIIKTLDVEVTKINSSICVNPKIIRIPVFMWFGFAVCVTSLTKIMGKYNA